MANTRNVVVFLLLLAACKPVFAVNCLGDFRFLVESFLKKYSSNFSYSGHDFWIHNERFGFLREGDKLVLIAKDEALAKELLADLERANPTTSAASAKPVSRPKIGGVAYDVTAMIPAHLRGVLGKEFWEGPNCFNLCLFHTNLVSGLVNTSREELEHWTSPESPLAEPVKSVLDLKPGDVIVFEKKTATGSMEPIHGSVYLSPRMVLSKPNMYQHGIPELVDISRMYEPFKQDTTSVKLYRFLSLPDFLKKNPQFKSEKFDAILRELDALEKEATELARTDGEDLLALAGKKQALSDKADALRRRVVALEDEVLFSSRPKSEIKTLGYLYRGLALRLRTSFIP